MFSYTNCIDPCLSGKKSQKKDLQGNLFFKFSLLNLPEKKIRYNSIDFSEIKKEIAGPVHSPKVPQLPSISTPRKKRFQRRSQSIDCSASDDPEKTTRNTTQLKFNYMPEKPFEPKFESSRDSTLKISSLNTKYQSNQWYIMENLEKARKYFPIPIGRKQLRTTSMSISHTPMTRLLSPQNFTNRKKIVKILVKTEKKKTLPDGIEVKGRCAVRKKSFKNKHRPSKDLYAHLISFSARIDVYKKKFEEADRAKKGYLLLEDFFAQSENFELAQRLFKLFSSVSNRFKVPKKDFLAVCAVYEHNGGEAKNFKLDDGKMVGKLEKQLEELREVFEMHSKNNQICKGYLQEVSEYLQVTEDVYKAESLVLTEPVTFSWFLRYVPYFLFIHSAVLNKTIS